MTDRELLELAAKAAGYDAVFRDDGSCKLCSIAEGCAYVQHWNPLTDDGDALRLAVKLRIGIKYDDELAICTANNQVESFWNRQNDAEATRRAIVRAAAEIGKAMK